LSRVDRLRRFLARLAPGLDAVRDALRLAGPAVLAARVMARFHAGFRLGWPGDAATEIDTAQVERFRFERGRLGRFRRRFPEYAAQIDRFVRPTRVEPAVIARWCHRLGRVPGLLVARRAP